MLGQVRFQLEVGFEFAGTELALVGAVNHNDLFGVSLALLVLGRLHLDVRVLIMNGLPLAALWICPCHTVLTLPRDVWNAPSFHEAHRKTASECLNEAGQILLPA